jgi:Immunoglobulin domain/Laminin B (Domain IV)
VVKGQMLTLRVNVSNAIPPAVVQWFRNGASIVNATNATLVLSNVQAAIAGLYRVQVSNAIEVIDRVVANVSLEAELVAVTQNRFDPDAEQWSGGPGLWGGRPPGMGWQASGQLLVRGQQAGEHWWWTAPASLLNQEGGRPGGAVEFELKATAGGTNRPMVRLSGAGLVLVYACPTTAGTNWTQFRVSLTDAPGWQTLDGYSAPPSLLDAALAGGAELQIEGVFGSDSDTVSLDNVRLLAACTEAPPLLTIQLESNPFRAVLTWPAAAGCYHLEAAETLNSQQWTTNLTVLQSEVIAGQQHVTIDLPSNTRFFRLRRD